MSAAARPQAAHHAAVSPLAAYQAAVTARAQAVRDQATMAEPPAVTREVPAAVTQEVLTVMVVAAECQEA